MQFYRIGIPVTDEELIACGDDRRLRNERRRKLAKSSNEFNRQLKGEAFFFVVDEDDDSVTAGAIVRDPAAEVKDFLSAFTDKLGLNVDPSGIETEEVTFDSVCDMLSSSNRSDYIKDDDEILERFGLDKLAHRHWGSFDFGENIIERAGKKELYDTVSRFLARDTFLPELDRIYAGSPQKRVSGHPVHYMIQTDDRETRKVLYRVLLQALYSNGRIHSRRYCFVDIKPSQDLPRSVYDCMYRSCAGGAVIVRYLAGDDSEDDHASSSRETIEVLCETMMKYRNQVLTVFCLPRECSKSKEVLYGHLGNTSIVELREEFVSGERAKDFLKMLAKGSGVRADRKLFDMLEEGEGYLAPDLHDLFDEWFSDKLRTGIYPQYKDMTAAKKEAAKAASKGSAYDELSQMIGLEEAKKVIDQALDLFKAQRLFADKGMKQDLPAMHMVFTGNPGTAKTTVARLFARIMQENGLLSKGRCIECGRGDLVGRYVGWTAPLIQKKFREAEGSVLFIDEAYSLVDDRDGSYGDEAINTIVQEMENHREDVIVIFAGYPDKMEKFLRKNPGLRSRIAFHVPFEDYDTEDLCRIAKLIAKNKGLTLTDDAVGKLAGVFDTARIQTDFGNGRYVRNVIEKARMAQASRLLTMDCDSVKRKDVATILADDIEIPAAIAAVSQKQIGFRA